LFGADCAKLDTKKEQTKHATGREIFMIFS
jgi:hypothetical protein